MDRTPTPPTGESSNGIVPSSPLPLSPSTHLTAAEDERTLFLSSLQAGSTSRSRRRSIPNSNSNPGGGEAMQLLPPSSSSTTTHDEEETEVEISPEEIRARRIEELTRVQTSERTSLENDLEALRRLRELRHDLSAANQAELEGEVESVVWRNSPIPIPRLSSLPRGGRTFPYTTTTTTHTSTFSPQNPPSTSSSTLNSIFSPPPPRSSSSSSAQIIPTQLPSFETLFSRVAATTTTQGETGGGNERSLRSYFLEPTHLVGEGFDDSEEPELEEGEGEGGFESLRELVDSRRRETGGGQEREWTMISRPFSANTRTTEEEADGILRDLREIGSSGGENGRIVGNNSRVRAANNQRRERRDPDTTATGGEGVRVSGRTREETNSLSGRALRSKKGVYLIYCGGSSLGEEEVVPAGFTAKGGGGSIGRGCGALLCSRGLVEGVPKKVFVDRGEELEGMSSDLPPSSLGLADLEDEEEGLGERVGKRGWKNCKGCITRDLGCLRCGNHVGYRLLRPDVYCSIARSNGNNSNSNTSSTSFTSIFHLPPWARTTPAAAANSNSTSSPSSTPPSSSSGGVTGGGVVDGLLFHFRSDRVTSLRRRVGITPSNELKEERESVEKQDEVPILSREEAREEMRKRAEAQQHLHRGLRLKETTPEVGEGMIWKNIPSPQRDFLSGLISEPLDWLTPGQETWWLENSISKHSYSISGTRRSSLNPDSSAAKDLSTDTLSSATTTSTSNAARSNSGANLNRSPAIRVRVPLASNSNVEVGDYDRYRTDASSYARRVRQRIETNSGGRVGGDSSTGDGRIVRSLESAGYGSWYQNHREEEEAVGEEFETKEGSSRKRKRGSRQSVGR